MRRRVALLPLLALGHVAVVAMAVGNATAARPGPAAMAIATYAVPAQHGLVIPPPPVVEVPIASDVAAPAFETAAEQSASTGQPGDCGLLEAVRTALIASPATGGALAAIPTDARTVANAVMLWDGRWSSLPGPAGTDGVARLRVIVSASVRSAPASCRNARVSGPRLIMLPEGDGTVVLAVGSGVWSWAELAT